MKVLLHVWAIRLSLGFWVILGGASLPLVLAERGRAEVVEGNNRADLAEPSQQEEGDRLFQSGLDLREQGELTAALEAFEAALVIYGEVGDRQSQIDTLNQIGNVHLDLGQHEQATVAYQGAIALQQQDTSQPVATASAASPPESREVRGTRSSGISTSEESPEDWGEPGGSRGPAIPDVSPPPLANPGPPLDTEPSDWREPGGSRGAVSQQAVPQQAASPQDEAIAFHPPETSRRAWGSPGGSRGSLLSWSGNQPTALVKDSQTIAAHPTVFIYLPEIDQRGEDGVIFEFTVWNEIEELYTLTTPPLSIMEGIVGIDIGDNANIPPLEVDQQYEWGISIETQFEQRVLARGWIIRIEQDSLGLSPEAIALAEQPYVYRDAGLWYDAVRTLFEIRQMDPDDETNNANLQELLDWLELENITADDFLGYWSDFEPSGEVGGEPASLSEPATNAALEADEQPAVSTYQVPPAVAPPSFGAPGGSR
ncbi:MAG: DUF928 domain-containing protein [Cyanothece sp. SIO2G6]|nr:DUF928 domain-containing protein [Cyanothece sp. SIO2G6]